MKVCVYAIFAERVQLADHKHKANFDLLAYKYLDEVVYAWKGHERGNVGRVLCMGGTHARICIGGTGVHTLKRDDLVR